MRTIIIISLVLALPTILLAQQTYVPDDNFEQALIDWGYDTRPLNDSVPTANIDTVKYLYVSEKNIADLTGIEDFEALETLYCNKNKLTSLDLTQNIRLDRLEFDYNFIMSLDLTQNTALINLCCDNNRLSSLDVNQNTALRHLSCDNNRLSKLDLTQNTALEWLDCYNNELLNLDVTQSANLIELKCFDNQISSLDVTQNTSLEWLHCYNNELVSLDLTQNAYLINLRCNDNQISRLDVSQNTRLLVLYCYNNKLSSLNVTQNENLFVLKCHKNQISNLDLTQNTRLRLLDCSENLLMNLNVKNGNNTYMTSESDDGGLDARNNPNLSCIQVDDSVWSANEFKWRKDEHAHYSENCGYTGIDFRAADETDNISISSSPNPFSQSTMINYQLAMPGRVVLKVYDNLGQEITTLIDEFKDAGVHQARFNAGNLPQGIYFYKIQIDNAVVSGKLLLIK